MGRAATGSPARLPRPALQNDARREVQAGLREKTQQATLIPTCLSPELASTAFPRFVDESLHQVAADSLSPAIVGDPHGIQHDDPLACAGTGARAPRPRRA